MAAISRVFFPSSVPNRVPLPFFRPFLSFAKHLFSNSSGPRLPPFQSKIRNLQICSTGFSSRFHGRCFRCGSRGHFARLRISCYFCRGRGHKSNRCFKKLRPFLPVNSCFDCGCSLVPFDKMSIDPDVINCVRGLIQPCFSEPREGLEARRLQLSSGFSVMPFASKGSYLLRPVAMFGSLSFGSSLVWGKRVFSSPRSVRDLKILRWQSQCLIFGLEIFPRLAYMASVPVLVGSKHALLAVEADFPAVVVESCSSDEKNSPVNCCPKPIHEEFCLEPSSLVDILDIDINVGPVNASSINDSPLKPCYPVVISESNPLPVRRSPRLHKSFCS